MNYSPRKSLAAFALVSGITFALATPGFAQAKAAGAATDEKVTTLEKFEVTGSYIPFAGTVTSVPVTILDSKAIEATGITTNLLEVLRKAAPQFSGNGNLGNSNANISAGGTGGGSALAFRNTQTLVLVNGRRVAYSAILASGGGQFVDVNLIPISAVERIEILQDGASAIYGTDAVAGVVNIIMKTDFKGFELTTNYGFATEKGHYEQRHVSLVGGASTEKTSITISADWQKSDPLYQFERAVSSPSFGSATFAGIINIGSSFFVLNPSLNAPPAGHLPIATLVANGVYIPIASVSNLINGVGAERRFAFDLSNFPTLLLSNERIGATIAFDHKFADKVTVFGDLLYTQTNTQSQLNAQPTSFAVVASNPTNPTDVTVRARNRFLDHPRIYNFDTNGIRGVLGIKGEFGDGFRWEAAANKNILNQNYSNPGVIDSAARAAAITSGAVNYFARQNPPGVVDAAGFFATALGKADSTLTNYDARVTGKIVDLPGGELGFAVGAEYRIETLKQLADRGSQSATFAYDSATTLDPFQVDRNVKSVFAQVRVPIFGGTNAPSGLHLLETEIAVRHEIYSDTTDPTVPKYSIRWLPFDEQLAFRATYSKSFAAPTLFNLFGPGGIGFTGSLALARFGGGPNITGQANATSGSNPNLLPSNSKNYTAGVVWSPKAIKGFSVTVDYFNIKQTDLVSTIGSSNILQDVELNGAASPFAKFVRIADPGAGLAGFNSGAPITAPGQIGNAPSIDSIFVRDTLVNIAQQHLAGFDINIKYTWNNDTLGRFDFGLAGAYYTYYRGQTLPGTPEFETKGLVTGFNGTLPEWQTYTNVAWTRGKWGANLGWQYLPSVKDLAFGDPTATDPGSDVNVEAYSVWDASVRYSFGSEWKLLNGLTLSVGVNNAFNETPPKDLGSFGGVNADTATYNPVGRFVYVNAKYKF